jgi:hypothetical protein
MLTTPTPTVKAMLQAKALAWKPDTIVINSVSASDAVMRAAEERQLKEYVQGAISDSYIKNPGNPRYRSDAAVKRYFAMAKKYGKGNNTLDGIYYRRREGLRRREAAVQGRQEADPRLVHARGARDELGQPLRAQGNAGEDTGDEGSVPARPGQADPLSERHMG